MVRLSYTFFLVCIVTVGCTDPFRTQFEDTEEAVMYQAVALKPTPILPDSLTCITWNLRYGAGRIPVFYDGRGDRYNMTKSEIETNLAGICKKINELDPDLILIQEVDIESKRTAYVDQLQYILNHTSMNYGIYAAIWKSDFVPSDGIGRINTGNAILSRWRLENAERIALPIRTDQSSLEKYFWFHRNILKARIAIPGSTPFYILNMHAEAWGKDGTKKKHIDRFKQELDNISNAGCKFFAGGDFNELPPGSPRWKNFDDDIPISRFGNDDYTGEEAWLNELYASYTPAISGNSYIANPNRYFTYTGDEHGFWCRTLDYLFTNTSFSSAMIVQDTLLPKGGYGIPTMPLSDHAPIYTIVKAKP